MLPTIHEVRLSGTEYRCRACDFRGTLEQAVEHAVKNQFVVVEKKEDRNA